MCKFFPGGGCVKGENCTYAHGNDDQNEEGPLPEDPKHMQAPSGPTSSTSGCTGRVDCPGSEDQAQEETQQRGETKEMEDYQKWTYDAWIAWVDAMQSSHPTDWHKETRTWIEKMRLQTQRHDNSQLQRYVQWRPQEWTKWLDKVKRQEDATAHARAQQWVRTMELQMLVKGRL